jgi:hypothetical protein
MDGNDLGIIALCLVSPFCAVAGLLSGLLWRLHFALGGLATLAMIWFLTVGVMPLMLLPTILSAIVWTAIGSAVAGLFLRRQQTTAKTAGDGPQTA